MSALDHAQTRRPLVGYHVRTPAGSPVNVRGLAYDYIVAAGGVYLAAANAFLGAMVPVAPGQIRGLEAVQPSLDLKPGRIPNEIWQAIRAICAHAARREHEVLCEVVHTGTGYALARPRQVTSAVAVRYERSDRCVLQLHSHHCLPAYFSRTDDADEQGLGLYGVLGRLGAPGRRVEVLLRVGAYGSFAAVPWDLVFAGEIGEVHDLSRGDQPGDREDEDVRRPNHEEAPR